MATSTRTRKPATERQRDLLAAALERFAADGFDGTSVHDVARQAGVATGTVYLYFPSKEHLLLGLRAQFHDGLGRVLTELAEELRGRIDAGDRIDVGEASDRVVDALVGYSVEHRAHCLVLTTYLPRLTGSGEAEATRDPFGELLGTVLRDAVGRGVIDLSHPEIAARMLSTATIQTIGPAVSTGDTDYLHRLTEQTKEIFRRVLRPAEWRGRERALPRHALLRGDG